MPGEHSLAGIRVNVAILPPFTALSILARLEVSSHFESIVSTSLALADK